MNHPIATAILALGLLAAVGCQTAAPPNRGSSGHRLDPSHDATIEYGVQAPRSPDLVAATDRMAQDIASRLDVNDPTSPPRIVVGEIENRSSLPEHGFQAFLVRLRAQLQASGARHGLEFVRERAFIEDQRDREYGGRVPDATADAYASRADFVLTCELYDLPSGETNYFLFDYQLVQLRDARTGPDVGPGAIVWENMYEVKYQ